MESQYLDLSLSEYLKILREKSAKERKIKRHERLIFGNHIDQTKLKQFDSSVPIPISPLSESIGSNDYKIDFTC
jgi:hypothetical protein